MTNQYTQSRSSKLSTFQREVLLRSVKYKLLALKEFETCHVTAKWIRDLFLETFRRQESVQEIQKAGARQQENMDHFASSSETHNTYPPSAQNAASTYQECMQNMPQSVDHSMGASIPLQDPTSSFMNNLHINNFSWDEWPLTQDLGYPDMGLIDSADISTIGELPFPWSNATNMYRVP